MDSDWPKTLEEAANRLLEEMSASDKRALQNTKRDDLIIYLFTAGIDIRNAFGLWQGNEALLKSSGSFDPDTCSMKIIERVWEKLNESKEHNEDRES